MRLLILALVLLLANIASAQQIPPAFQSITAQDAGTACSVAGSCASWSLPNQPTVTIQITGSCSCTLTFEGTADGVSWFSVSATNLSSGTAATTTTTTGQYSLANTGFASVRVRAGTFASGGLNLKATRGWSSLARSGGGGGTPGGSSGDLQYNNAGAFGGYTPGTGVVTFLQTPSSANLASALTDETGTGVFMLNTNPTLAGASPKVLVNGFPFLYAPNGGGHGQLYENVCLGYKACNAFTAASTGGANVVMGFGAGLVMNGDYPLATANTIIGYGAGELLTTGDHNTFIGADAGIATTTGHDQVYIGSHTGGKCSGSTNIAIGTDAMNGSTTTCTGVDNFAFGLQALFRLTSGTRNVALGGSSLFGVTTGGSNIAVGFDSLDGVTTGGFNTALGVQTGNNLTTGSNNIVIGNGIALSSASVSNTAIYGPTSIVSSTVNGSLILNSATPAVANVGADSCGTTAATIAGNNNIGDVTVGATAGSQCRLTFTVTAPNGWNCSANDTTTAVLVRASPVDTTHADLLGTFTAGDVVSYQCFAR